MIKYKFISTILLGLVIIFCVAIGLLWFQQQRLLAGYNNNAFQRATVKQLADFDVSLDETIVQELNSISLTPTPTLTPTPLLEPEDENLTPTPTLTPTLTLTPSS